MKHWNKLTILHPLATNVLKSGPLLGQQNSGFNFWPVMFGQKDTLRDSMTWQCLLMAARPASVRTEQPLRSKHVKVRPTAKQICTQNNHVWIRFSLRSQPFFVWLEHTKQSCMTWYGWAACWLCRFDRFFLPQYLIALIDTKLSKSC